MVLREEGLGSERFAATVVWSPRHWMTARLRDLQGRMRRGLGGVDQGGRLHNEPLTPRRNAYRLRAYFVVVLNLGQTLS